MALSAPDIGLDSRLITVADIYDALTADRPYRAGMTRGEAFAVLESMRGTSVDGQCLDALRRLVDEGEAAARAA